jgi:O-antigen ligase
LDFGCSFCFIGFVADGSVGKGQKIRREENEKVRENSRLRSDELQRAREVGKRQRSEVRGQKSEGQGLGKDEHRTSNIERPTSNGKMKLKSEVRKQKSAAYAKLRRAKEVGREWRCISINRHGTLRMLLKFLAYVGVFFIVLYFNPSGQKGNRQEKSNVSVRSRKGVVPDFIFGLIWVIFFLGLFNAVFFFLQKASGMRLVWLGSIAPSTGNCLGTFKAFNNFSEFLEMVVPLAMGLLIAQSYLDVRRMSRVHGVKFAWAISLFSKTGLMSFGIVLMISALLLSLCKGGFVTFPITMVVVLVFMIVSYRLHDRRVFALFALVLVGAACYLAWLGLGPIINELQYLFKDLGPQGRSVTYRDAVSIIKDFPLFGVGFGNWHDIIMKYHTMVGRETWMPAIAYNDTLQITAETGFAGLTCVATFLFMIYRKAIKALKRGGDVVSQALILGGITAMTAALIHCQFDYLFYLPSNAVVFMVIAGMTYRLSITN